MPNLLSAGELARRLSRHVEAVCRHYLKAGRKEGRYWLVGDTSGAPGRSLYVRLSGPESGKGAAGHWTDYVAPGVMLRSRDWARCPVRSTASAQHNLSAREVS
jgi:hypothetical protein